MTRTECFKKLALFLEPYLKYGIEPLTLVLSEGSLVMKTPHEMDEKDIIVKKFLPKILMTGLSGKEWQSLVDDIYTLNERFPGCLE